MNVQYLFNVKRSGYLFALAIFVGYCLVPFTFLIFNPRIDALYDLTSIAMISAIAIAVGFWINLNNEDEIDRRLTLDMEPTLLVVWGSFLAFAMVALVTAPSIPLISAIFGSDAATLAYEREMFFKARSGWQAYLVYINALYCGAVIPLTLSLMFIRKFRYRWVLSIIFLLYTFSFIEKAFFLKLALPLIYLIIMQKISTPIGSKTAIFSTLGLLLLVTNFSGVAGGEFYENTIGDFFSRTFTPNNAISHIAWRSLVVPVFTAADAVSVYLDYFRGRPLMGSTSGFIAMFTGERVEFERLVFEAQWGQNETGTGSSNTAFFVEAFINFGYVGVIIFSLFVGQSLRWLANCKDEFFRSLWPLYCFNLYTAGLIGILLSNGFAVIFLSMAIFSIRPLGFHKR